MQRIAITGSSGYVGRRLIEALRRSDPKVRIFGLDRVAPRDNPPDRFEQIEICEPRLADLLVDFAPDTVIHLAFILNPIHRETEMRRVNVGGTRNVAEAVAAVGAERFLFVSSAVALGAAPDNPVPMPDRHPRGGKLAFRYAADKSEAEEIVADFAEAHPESAVSWVRPAIVLGPGVDNYLSRLLLRFPVVFLLDGRNTPMQFVEVNDVIMAILTILQRNGRGPFNVAPPDWLGQLEIALETGRRVIHVPMWAGRIIVQLCWIGRLPLFSAPAAVLDYLRHPWVVMPGRLTDELGFEFRYGSRQVLKSLLGAARGS